MISGLLLAAGESSRMKGAFKPLLKWGNKTVIEASIDNLRRSRLDEIIVVLGHRESEIRERLAGKGIQYAINPDYTVGMLSSIKTGWAEISPQAEAVMIALVDQPMVSPSVIDAVIARYLRNGRKIAVPVFQGRRGHPAIFSRDLEEELMRLDETSPEGMRALLAAYPDEVLEVPVESSSVVEDIDQPEDYERLSRAVTPVYEHHKWHP